MKIRLFTLALLLFALALPLCAQEGGAGDMEAAMKEYMALIQPGPQHKMLAEGVGEWNVAHKMWMDPAAAPTEQTGKAKAYTILDGRYLVEEYETTMMGMPFKGQSLTGFDNYRKEFWSTWIDNMSTGVMISRGTWDDATKTLTMTGTMDDPMTNQKDQPVRTILKHNADGTHSFEMWGKTPDGKDVKYMEMLYTKAK